jgi:ABC-type proline/glycine betaine transport system permease subunit
MALPVIFGGIRTAVVMNIGVMAIAAVIGAGGLGLLLLNGIGGSDIRMLIAGALMICLLAIVLDWLLSAGGSDQGDSIMIKLENLTKHFTEARPPLRPSTTST